MGSKHPHDGLQLLVTPVAGDPGSAGSSFTVLCLDGLLGFSCFLVSVVATRSDLSSVGSESPKLPLQAATLFFLAAQIRNFSQNSSKPPLKSPEGLDQKSSLSGHKNLPMFAAPGLQTAPPPHIGFCLAISYFVGIFLADVLCGQCPSVPAHAQTKGSWSLTCS